jgi:predicted MFS family arabinose efflux permease
VAIVFRGEKQVGRRGTSREFTKEVVSTVKNRDVALLLITGFTVFASFIGVISFLSVHLDAEGYGSGAIGFALMFSGLSGVFLSPIAGKLVDSKGTRCCVSLGLLIAGVATFAMYDLDAYIGYIALLAIMGFGSSFIWSALLTMLMRASPASRDTSSPVFNSARFTGYALSTMLLAPVYESSGFGAVILICGAANVFCLVLVLGTRRSLDRG